jgi:predicted patatin/cPLA2 family phospholipase
MQNTTAKAKFNSSRQQLSSALNNLEKIIKNKLEQNKNENNFANSQENFEEAEMKIHQQKLQIENLSNEINSLQQSFGEVCKENELLHSKSLGNIDKKIKFTNQTKDLIESLGNKLMLIEKIISKS